jgi:hypothetical protein
MSAQSRVPGAASSEVDFELERFERTGADRIEIAGRWFGLRGRRFVRPVLNLHIGGGSRRRAIALLEHKPWAADDGETWVAAFAWPQGAGAVESAVLEVGPGLIVDLPAPGGKPGSQGRVSALRPHAPAPMARRVAPEDGELEGADDGGAAGGVGDPAGGVRTRDRRGDAAAGALGAGGSVRAALDAGARAAAAPLSADDAPEFTLRERTPAPPRDIVTAAMQERDKAVAARDEAERERVQALTDRDDALSRRDAALRDVDRAAAERDEAVAERDRVAAELERVTRERDVADAERKRTIQDAEAIERERDQAAAERDAARSELSRALPARDEAIRERDAEAARADLAERDRDAALIERKSAVAQRDRARRERDRAMRAAGVEPPEESPYVAAARADEPDEPRDDAPPPRVDDAGPATPPGTPLPSRPVKRIGAARLGPAPETKPLLTPVDAGRPRRLSRTRRPPSATARWAVRITVIVLMIAIAIVLVILLGRAL